MGLNTAGSVTKSGYALHIGGVEPPTGKREHTCCWLIREDATVMRRPLFKRGGILVIGVALLVSSVIPALAVIEAEEAFLNTWARTDRPVAEGAVARTWMWGPKPATSVIAESYREHPTTMRPVQYWDKARMEVNNPNADPASLWYVTNGLLAKELMSGRMQFGDTHHIQYAPSTVHIAGDAFANVPTYATFGTLMDRRSVPPGSTIPVVPITQTVDSEGRVGNEGILARYDVRAGHYEPRTNHVVASVFWEFMNSSGVISPDGHTGPFTTGRLFPNPYYATGLPLTEAYWVYVPVKGVQQWVLVQAFERRVMTYTPGNPAGWRVEAGNVGQHYYLWRYGKMPKYETE
jgi:hypothetical protein